MAWSVSNTHLQQILLNVLLTQEAGQNSTWVMARSFYKLSGKWVASVSVCLHCSSESGQERTFQTLCLYCLFPVWQFGSLWGMRHCSPRPIKHKHQTMDDGQRSICSKGYLCWCHLRATQQEMMSKNCSTHTHSEGKSLLQILTSDKMSSALSGWIIVIK